MWVDYCRHVLITTISLFNFLTWLISFFLNDNKVYLVSWWSIPILLWCRFLECVLVCWSLTYPFVFCNFALFLLGDLFFHALEVVLFLALCLFALCSPLFKCFVGVVKQRGQWVCWAYCLLVICWPFPPWYNLLLISGWPSYISSSWWLCIMSPPLLFFSFCPCGPLSNVSWQFHVSLVFCLLTTLLQSTL